LHAQKHSYFPTVVWDRESEILKAATGRHERERKREREREREDSTVSKTRRLEKAQVANREEIRLKKRNSSWSVLEHLLSIPKALAPSSAKNKNGSLVPITVLVSFESCCNAGE
jgi:hypothetical protein